MSTPINNTRPAYKVQHHDSSTDPWKIYGHYDTAQEAVEGYDRLKETWRGSGKDIRIVSYGVTRREDEVDPDVLGKFAGSGGPKLPVSDNGEMEVSSDGSVEFWPGEGIGGMDPDEADHLADKLHEMAEESRRIRGAKKGD